MLTLGLIPGEPNRSTGGRGYLEGPRLGAGGTTYQAWQEKHPTTSWPPAVPTEADLAKVFQYWPVHQGWLQTKKDYGNKFRTHYMTNPFNATGAYLTEKPITKKYAQLAGIEDAPEQGLTSFQKWTLAISALSALSIATIAITRCVRRR